MLSHIECNVSFNLFIFIENLRVSVTFVRKITKIN